MMRPRLGEGSGTAERTERPSGAARGVGEARPRVVERAPLLLRREPPHVTGGRRKKGCRPPWHYPGGTQQPSCTSGIEWECGREVEVFGSVKRSFRPRKATYLLGAPPAG